MPLDEATIQTLITHAVQVLETKCIRLNGVRVPWQALFAEALPDLQRCRSNGDLEAAVSKVLAQGGLSHVAFFHESAERAPARYAINATFCPWDGADSPRWVFQDVHEGGPAHTAGLRAGDVLVAVDGEAVRPPKLPTFALGKDAVLAIEDRRGDTRELTVVLPKADPRKGGKGKPPMAVPTSVTSRLLEDGLGYLRVAFFPGATGQRFAQDLGRALAALGDRTRLIVDLRGNLGGFVGSLRLMSVLTPDRTPVGYSLTRLGEDRGLRREQLPCIDRLPETVFDKLRMVARFRLFNKDRSVRLVTEGLGPRPFHGRVVMLINEHTASASEMVAAFAAENRLATLVGTRTAGEVLGGANVPVGEGFILRFPAAGWYMWSGSIMEGRGVSPDVDVPQIVDALRQGRDKQLEGAIEVSTRR